MNIIPCEDRNVMISKTLADAKFNLGVAEISIITGILGGIGQSKEMEDRFYELSIGDYCELRGVERKTAREVLEEASKSLWDKYIVIWDFEKEEYIKYRWVIAMSYEVGTGISLQFNPRLLPHLCQLKRYCTIPLAKISKFKHSASYRLYFILANHKYKSVAGVVEFKLMDFLESMQLEDTCYREFGMLNARILKPAFKELEEKKLADIKIELIKNDKKVIAFRLRYTLTIK